MRTGANRALGGRTAVGAGDALSRQFGRACQVGGAQLGNGANVREHVREMRNEMSSSEEVRAARDPDFASPDPSRRGKRKVTGEEGSEGESASQEQLRQGGDSANSAPLSGKGKRKLHPEDDEDLETGDSTFDPSFADTRKPRSKVDSRRKRHRLPTDTIGPSSGNTIELPDSPMPTGEDRTSRRSARVRYERGLGAIPTDTTVAQAGGVSQTSGRNTEGTDDQAASSVQAMVTRARRRDPRGHDTKEEDTPALEDESSTGRAPATNLRSHLSLPDPIRRGHLRRGFSPSSSFVGTSYRIRGNPSLAGPPAAAAGFTEAGYDSSGVRPQDRRLRMPERTAGGSGPGFVPRGPFSSAPGLSLERYGVGRQRRHHRSHLLGGGNQDMAVGTVTPGGTQVGQFTSGAAHAPIDLDDLESPRGDNRSVIELEDEPSESVRQLAEDERMARELQAELNGQVPEATAETYDAQMARSLQAHENNRMRLVTHPFFPNFMDEYSRHRAFHAPRRHRDRGASWRSRVDRHGLGPPLADGAGSSVRFPSHLSVEMRLEVLAALESAFQEHLPISLRLAQVDRDFNENDYEMLLALDDNNRMNGASAERIQQLPVTVLQPTDVSDEACAVCLEVPVVGDQIRRLPCMHAFHQQCIDKWLQAQAVCPVCKAQI